MINADFQINITVIVIFPVYEPSRSNNLTGILIFLVFHESDDIFFVQDKLVIVAVLPAGPADLSPEGIAHIIFGEGDQRDAVDALSSQRIHAVSDHPAPDALPAVFLGHTYMVEASLSPVAAAEDRTYDLLTADRDDTRRGISFQKTVYFFSGIIYAPDSEALNRHPQMPHLLIVLDDHGTDTNL